MLKLRESRCFKFAALLTLLLTACTEQSASNKTTIESRHATTINQAQLDIIAQELVVKHQFLSNVEENCPPEGNKTVKQCYAAEITLRLPSSVSADITGTGWFLYYSQVYPMYAFESDTLKMTHLNGDIHQISPNEKFRQFKVGQSHKVKLWVKSALISESQLFPNYWISGKHLMPRVIASTKTQRDAETGLERQPYVVPFDQLTVQTKSAANDINPPATAKWLFEHNITSDLTFESVKHRIIPTPKTLHVDANARELSLANGINLMVDGFDSAQLSAAVERLALLGVAQTEGGVPVVVTQSNIDLKQGGYHLTVTEHEIRISAAEASGAFYGLQSIAAMLPLQSLTIPQMKIVDEPHYSYRGQHLDVARNFHSKEMLLALIRQMAAYKLNKLHLHLAEDEGWRLALPSFPELTAIGGKRCMDLSDKTCLQPQLGGAGSAERDGFYSVTDYLEILRVASQHHIQVIPSLDMPGHSRAAIKAMEARYRYYLQQENEQEANKYLLSDLQDRTKYRSIQHYTDNTINVCLESSYRFVNRVLDDLIAMHQQAEHPLAMYHIGADETAGAWVNSPACQALIHDKTNDVHDVKHLGAHFIERVSHMIAAKGIAIGGWNDGLGETNAIRMPANIYSYMWETLPHGAHKQVSEHARRGWQVILSTPDVLYFDFPYEIDPKERGYHWASRRVNSRTVFNFMPDNLPVHAEFRVDTLGHTFESNDMIQKDNLGNVSHQPLPEGYRITGIQGQVWSETIRSDHQAEYMLYPRMIALAERAWHSAKWAVPYDYQGRLYHRDSKVFKEHARQQRDQDWEYFSATVGFKELAKLERADVFYRLPTVGAKINNGLLHANVSIIGLPIEYRVVDSADNVTQENNWQPYQKPVVVAGVVEVRARSIDGLRAGRSLTVQKD